MRSANEQAKFEVALTQLYEQRITFNHTLGLKVVSLDPNAPVSRFAMKPEFVGHYDYGRLHGGVISAVLDAQGGFALMVKLAERFPDDTAEQVIQRFSKMGTIDLRVDFLAQGLGTYFDAHATVTRLGKRIASVQMSLKNDVGDLIATGAAAYVVS